MPRFLRDARSGAVLPLPEGAGAVVVGRANDAHLRVSDPTISRYQFQLTSTGSTVMVENISGTTPTLVNGRPVMGSVPISSGDQISAGQSEWRFEASAGETSVTEGGTIRATPEALQAVGLAARSQTTIPAEEVFRRDVTTIGREAPADLVIDHPTVSRLHATIRREQDGFFIEDHRSTNGTFVDGQRIGRKHALQPGERIDIGPYSLTWLRGEAVAGNRTGNAAIVGHNLVREVSGKEGTLRILDDVSVVIDANEFVCILGPSGSGKTTLMNALSARQPADQGTVLVGDLPLYENFEVLKEGMALVPQHNVLYEALTVREGLYYTAKLRLPADMDDEAIDRATLEAAQAVDLEPRLDTRVANLSGGQKKRASLANETVSQPSLLFLDEVTSGLDEGTDWEMMQLFRRMADRGMTVVCVTHTVANVEEFCHRVVVMANPGCLAFVGSPKEALSYFGVAKLGDIYRVLEDRPGKEWKERFRAHPLYGEHVPAGSDPALQGASNQVERPRGLTFVEALRQFTILTQRYARLVLADRESLLLAAGQSAMVGLFMCLVFGTVEAGNPLQVSYLFLAGMSSLWYGGNNASKEIVKERDIFIRERDVNLALLPYLASKFFVLGLVGAAQIGLLVGILQLGSEIPGDLARQATVLVLGVLAGTAMGLAISAASKTRDQASTIVPIALIPQIILGGLIVRELSAIPDFLAHTVISGFWIFDAMEAILLGESPATGVSVLLLHIAALPRLLLRDHADPRHAELAAQRPTSADPLARPLRHSERRSLAMDNTRGVIAALVLAILTILVAAAGRADGSAEERSRGSSGARPVRVAPREVVAPAPVGVVSGTSAEDLVARVRHGLHRIGAWALENPGAVAGMVVAGVIGFFLATSYGIGWLGLLSGSFVGLSLLWIALALLLSNAYRIF